MSLIINNHQKILQGTRAVAQGLRKDLICSSKGPGFDPQHPYGDLEPSVTPEPGDLTPSLWPLGKFRQTLIFIR